MYSYTFLHTTVAVQCVLALSQIWQNWGIARNFQAPADYGGFYNVLWCHFQPTNSRVKGKGI